MSRYCRLSRFKIKRGKYFWNLTFRILFQWFYKPHIFYILSECVYFLLVSDTEMSSEFKVYKFEPGMLSLWSDAASERLEVMLSFLKLGNDQFDEIIPSCDVDITRSDYRDYTLYSAFVTNCMAPIFEEFISDVTKDNKRVASRDYLSVAREETASFNKTTVGFNNTVMSNENVVLNSLIFRIYNYQNPPLNGLIIIYSWVYGIL